MTTSRNYVSCLRCRNVLPTRCFRCRNVLPTRCHCCAHRHRWTAWMWRSVLRYGSCQHALCRPCRWCSLCRRSVNTLLSAMRSHIVLRRRVRRDSCRRSVLSVRVCVRSVLRGPRSCPRDSAHRRHIHRHNSGMGDSRDRSRSRGRSSDSIPNRHPSRVCAIRRCPSMGRSPSSMSRSTRGRTMGRSSCNAMATDIRWHNRSG